MTKSAIENLTQLLDWIDVALPASFDQDTRPPDRLYHYTSAGGLLGIVSSDTLRGTNFRFLNDRSEVAYGVEIAVSELSSFHAEHDWLAQAVAIAADALVRVAEQSEVYVTCFSALRDDLSQWRGYGSSGDRYCIGFSTYWLRHSGHVLAPVVYWGREQRARLQRILRRLADAAQAVMVGKDMPSADVVGLHLADRLLAEVSLFKSRAFEAEAEWRVVRIEGDVSKVELTLAGESLRPFIVAFSGCVRKAIDEVLVLSNRPQARKAAEILLTKARGGYACVNASAIPFEG